MESERIELSFRLTLAQFLGVNYGIWIVLATALLFLLIGILTFVRSRGRYRQLMVAMATFGCAAFLALAGWFVVGGTNAGWTLSGSSLTVKTGFGSAVIPVGSATAMWINAKTGPYTPVLRTDGTSTGQYDAGHFRLRNHDDALVFRYGQHPWLLIETKSERVLLSTPDITQLASHFTLVSSDSSRLPEVLQPHSHRIIRLLLAATVALIAFGLHWRVGRWFAPRLPDRLATHFGIDGKPNGWMKKRTALRFGPWISLLLGIFSVGLALDAWSVIAIFGAVQLLMLLVMIWVYRFNRMK